MYSSYCKNTLCIDFPKGIQETWPTTLGLLFLTDWDFRISPAWDTHPSYVYTNYDMCLAGITLAELAIGTTSGASSATIILTTVLWDSMHDQCLFFLENQAHAHTKV